MPMCLSVCYLKVSVFLDDGPTYDVLEIYVLHFLLFHTNSVDFSLNALSLNNRKSKK